MIRHLAFLVISSFVVFSSSFGQDFKQQTSRLDDGIVLSGASSPGSDIVAAGQDYYVDCTNGSNTIGDGSQAKPWKTISFALARVSGAGAIVHVSAGNYNTVMDGIWYEVFPLNMKNGISLIGEGSDVTILDADSSNGVVSCVGIGSETTLSGFTITGGNRNVGAGIYCSGSSLTIRDNRIISNYGTQGCGIYCGNSSSAIIRNNVISKNKDGSDGAYEWGIGGGIYISGSSPQIMENTIDGNKVDCGGGIYITGSSPQITKNTISQNYARGVWHIGGGGIVSESSSPVIAENTIIENRSTYGPGGIDLSYSSSAILKNNLILRNTAEASTSTYGGGAIRCNSSPIITNNTIVSNVGGVRGGVYCYGNADPTIRNNIFFGNSGYAIFEGDNASDPSTEYNLFFRNGSGLYYDEAQSGFPTVLVLEALVPECKNNLEGYPLFADTTNGDYRLLSGSPAIDAGDPAYPLDPDGTRADIGAFYYAQAVPIPSAPSLYSPSNGASTQPVMLTLSWTTSIGATKYHLQVSATSAFTFLAVNDSSLTGASKLVSSLSNGTMYYWRVRAGSTTGWSAFSGSWNFTTVSSLPNVSTSSITNLTTTSATVNGSVNPNGTTSSVWFEWGTSSTLSTYFATSSQTIGAGTSAIAVTTNLTGLNPNTTYYYRAVGQNGAGTQKGSILSFTTPALAVPTINSFSPTFGPVGTTVLITGTNFSTTAANNIVYFGAVRGTVTSATSTLLSVRVPIGASYAPITVTDMIMRLTAYSTAPFVVTFPSSRVIDATSFAGKLDITTGSSPAHVAEGDLDGDGRVDMVVANKNGSNVSIYRNTSTSGSISFAAKVDYTTGSSPNSVAIGDIDGDGKPDVAVVNYDSNTVSVFRNQSTNGTISFATKVDRTTGSSPNSVAIGDIDGDGKPDLAVTNFNSGTISIFRNQTTNGTIIFATKVDYTSGDYPSSVAIGDVNGDGKPDLVVTNRTSYTNGTVSIFKNQSTSGGISIASKVDYTTGSYPDRVAIGDMDGDGMPDLAIANYSNNTFSTFKNQSTGGSISFAAKVDCTTESSPRGVAIGDLDGDGRPDIAVTSSTTGTVSVFKNTTVSGSISFAARVDYTTGSYPDRVAIGDMDGDGKSDITAVNYGGNTVSVLRNTITTNTVPAIPQNLSATAGNGQVTLKWNKVGDTDLKRYRIYRGTASPAATLIDSTSAGNLNDTTRTISGLTNGTMYYFRVTAVDSAGNESGYSNEASATPSSPTTDLVQVTGGSFQMGSNDVNDYGASPPHSVTLSAFYIDKTEIAYEKWTDVRSWGLTHGYTDLVAGRNGYNGTTNHPVTEVNWYDIVKWCNARSEKDGLTPMYYTSNTMATVYRTGELDLAANAVRWTANGYRLPTEAEWEFAARGGTKSQGYIYSGSNTIDDVAWYDQNSGTNTHPVSTKGANELGLYDMSGNVYEWCWDWSGAYSSNPQTDPKGPTSGDKRVLRGGSFNFAVSLCRLADRISNNVPTDRSNNRGFRCVQTDSNATTGSIPAAPTLTTPADGTAGVPISPTLSWGTSAGATSYRLQVSTGSTFTTTVFDDSTLTATSRQVGPLSNNTKYYWRVNAKNVGGTSAFSLTQTFTTVVAALAAPALATPADGATGIASTTTLSWTAVTGATTYRIQLSTSLVFTTTVVDDSTVTGTSKSISGLASNTVYYWRVNAKNTAGTSAFSLTWSFTTIVAAPSAVTLASPANGANNQPTTVSLSWNSQLGATSYHLQVSTTSSFTTTILDELALTVTSKVIGQLVFGTTYYWRVNAANAAGSSAFSSTASFTTIPAPATTLTVNTSVSFPTKQKRQDYATSDYRLFGLPGGAIAANSVLSGTPGTDWQMYWDNGALSNYQVAYDGSTTFQFGNGRAFWILSKSGVNISTIVNGPSQNQFYEVEINLHAGWNLIANPFTAPIPWSRIQAANNTTGTIQTYNGSWATSSSFDPYVGYYFFNGSPQLSVLRVPYYGLYGDVGDPPGKAFDGWKVSVALNSDGVTCGETFFGVSIGAEQALDEFDIRKPRALGDISDIYFQRPEWDDFYPTFASDIRAVVGQTQEWSFSVTATPNAPSALRFSGIRQIPAQYEVCLLDKSSGKSIDLRRDSNYAFVSPLRTMELTVVVGTKDAVLKKASELLPTEFSMSQNFPNPFNPSTSVRVTVPVRSQIRITIYNLLGQPISTLYEGSIDAGIHWYTWNGQDEHQRTVTSGVYFCRLETDGLRPSIVRMILMK